jgi:nitrous oxidase accessory protein NosD
MPGNLVSWGRDRRGLIVICLFVAVLMMALLSSGAGGATIQVPGDQPTIQNAVDAARPGDTIRIAAGLYNESVDVTKQLTIEGDGAGVTVLSYADAHILKLTADGTRVWNLTIDGTHERHGIWLEDVRFCWIGNVTFTDNVRGVYMDNTDACLISDCSFLDSYKGVWIRWERLPLVPVHQLLHWVVRQHQ